MKLIPYSKFTIHSKYSVEQITSRLEEITTTKNVFAKMIASTLLVGTLHDKGFKVQASGRNEKGVYVRNSFKSINVAKYVQTENGVDIVVKQRLSIGVTIFLMFWTIMLLIVGGIGAITGEWVFLGFSIIMLLGMAVLTIFAFNYDAKKKQEILTSNLE